jgi:hypothetical protein
MRNISGDKLILIKKLVGLGSSILCLILMLLRFINYTSTSTLNSGSSITWDDGVSLFSFLFDEKYAVFDGTVAILREAFGYSYVIMWISFVLCLISIILLVVGVFIKKGIVSKIGSFMLVGAIILLFTIIFDREVSGNTIRYLNIFSFGYVLIVLSCSIGTVSTITLKDK